jgi:hypothetical protein
VGVARHYTVGAVAPDLGSLKGLSGRLEESGVPEASLLVLARRKDARLVGVTLPEAATRTVESGLTRMQWFEFGSTYLGVTSVSVLMGAVHLPTGLVVQAIMTVAAVIGLVLYHRHPRLKKKLLGMGLPEKLAEDWEAAFSSGFALALATVPEKDLDAAQDAFLDDPKLQALLAIDRRPVL